MIVDGRDPLYFQLAQLVDVTMTFALTSSRYRMEVHAAS